MNEYFNMHGHRPKSIDYLRLLVHFIHYKCKLQGHDIALLKLKKPVQSATPVCLPSEDIKSNESGIVIGWGITNPDVKSQLPNRLRQGYYSQV